jgi:hypothetical protein
MKTNIKILIGFVFQAFFLLGLSFLIGCAPSTDEIEPKVPNQKSLSGRHAFDEFLLRGAWVEYNYNPPVTFGSITAATNQWTIDLKNSSGIPADPSTGYDWKTTYDSGTIILREASIFGRPYILLDNVTAVSHSKRYDYEDHQDYEFFTIATGYYGEYKLVMTFHFKSEQDSNRDNRIDSIGVYDYSSGKCHKGHGFSSVTLEVSEIPSQN